METLRNIPPVIDAGMIQGLEAIYLEYSQEPDYPKGKCIKISREISRMFGLTFHHGTFELDSKHELYQTINLPHAWCEDGSNTIVDMTASQFNSNLKNPIPAGLILIKPGEELYSRYKKVAWKLDAV